MNIPDFAGFSRRFHAVLDNVWAVASAQCSVLVQGEAGTGKAPRPGFHETTLLSRMQKLGISSKPHFLSLAPAELGEVSTDRPRPQLLASERIRGTPNIRNAGSPLTSYCFAALVSAKPKAE
jgi:hypothetical protein